MSLLEAGGGRAARTRIGLDLISIGRTARERKREKERERERERERESWHEGSMDASLATGVGDVLYRWLSCA
jgi:hypothetical protein